MLPRGFGQLIVISGLSCPASLLYAAPPATPCIPSRITVHEAETLVQATDHLTSSRRVGEIPVLHRFEPVGKDVHPKDFFYFVVYDESPVGQASADGGLIGYYAVQEDTAKVFDFVLTEELDDEPPLKALESKLRHEHCVTDEVLKRWQDVWP